MYIINKPANNKLQASIRLMSLQRRNKSLKAYVKPQKETLVLNNLLIIINCFNLGRHQPL